MAGVNDAEKCKVYTTYNNQIHVIMTSYKAAKSCPKPLWKVSKCPLENGMSNKILKYNAKD